MRAKLISYHDDLSGQKDKTALVTVSATDKKTPLPLTGKAQ